MPLASCGERDGCSRKQPLWKTAIYRAEAGLPHFSGYKNVSLPPPVSYSSLRYDTESPYLLPVTALLCLAQGIHLNDTNLKIGIWALNLERVIFFSLWARFQRAPKKRERYQHTPGLHLFTTHLGRCNILSSEWPYRKEELTGIATKTRMTEE